MSDIKTLKTQAKHLVRSLEKQGINLTTAQSLEAVAAQYGFDNWDALVGTLKSRKDRAADHWKSLNLSHVDVVPSEIWVEDGPKRVLCTVETYEWEGLVLLHKPQELAEYLREAYPGVEGEAEALALLADGRDYDYTFNDLIGIEYVKLGGKGYWHAPVVNAYFEFPFWTPPEPPAQKLTVPELLKTPKQESFDK